jgi:hypothetical protein
MIRRTPPLMANRSKGNPINMKPDPEHNDTPDPAAPEDQPGEPGAEGGSQSDAKDTNPRDAILRQPRLCGRLNTCSSPIANRQVPQRDELARLPLSRRGRSIGCSESGAVRFCSRPKAAVLHAPCGNSARLLLESRFPVELPAATPRTPTPPGTSRIRLTPWSATTSDRSHPPAAGLSSVPRLCRTPHSLSNSATANLTGRRANFAQKCLVGATDIPDAWHSRFPATVEVTSNWPALAELGAPRRLVTEAMALDRQRIAGEDGLAWTPQFRDIEALTRMIDRVGERAALAPFISNLSEQVQGRQGAGRRGGRRLPDARPGRLRAPQGLRHPPPPQPARLPASGHLMSATQGRGHPAVFVTQLHLAAAQRGKLDPVYQELSDHWTAILQRLYPVWTLIGPGLSDPGHIEIHSRTIYLDPDTLLGSREQIITGRLERRAVLRCRATRDLPRQAHQTLGDRARHRAQRI